MPSPSLLIDVARQLLASAAHSTLLTSAPFDAHIRRAVSTAYYAVFHKLAGAAAVQFLGKDDGFSAAYRVVYRGLDHRRMREVCAALKTPQLSERYRDRLQRSIISQDLCDFATGFLELQDARHLADYDPAKSFFFYDASALVDAAVEAISAFERVATHEQQAVLALMLVSARG